MDYKEEYQKWSTDPFFDAQTKQELAQIQG